MGFVVHSSTFDKHPLCAALVIAAILTLLSLTLHYVSPSSLHQDEAEWQLRVEFHQSEPAFVVRPVTTTVVVFLHQVLGWSYRASFLTLQFTLLSIFGPIFFRYLRHLSFGVTAALWGMIIPYLCLPLCLAHFDPVYTWDDMWVYICIPLSLSCILKNRRLVAGLFFSLALLARETSLIFLPFLVALLYARDKRQITSAVLLPLGACALALAVRLTLSGAAASGPDLMLGFNFDNWMRTNDTLFSLLVSLGFLWPVGLYQASRAKAAVSIPFYTWLRWAAIGTSLGFVLATLLFARARETRLFFPPFVFLVPLALLYVQNNLGVIRSFRARFSPWLIATAVISLAAASMILSKALFPDFDFRTWKDGNRIFFGLHLAVVVFFLVIQHYRTRVRRTS